MSDKAFVWLEDFYRPLIAGGDCWVGDPLGPNLVRQALRLTHEAVFEETKHDLFAAYAKWLPPGPVDFSSTFGLLTVALYELCATAHPQTDAFYAQAHDFAAHAQAQIQDLEVPKSAEGLVVNHLAVAPLLSLSRKAIEVHWWSGQKTFFGESPKRHLLWLPKLRRVRLEEKRQPFWLAAWRSGDELNRNSRQKLLKTLLRQSPLTWMVAASSELPLTRFDINPLLKSGHEDRSSAFLLWEDPTLARGIVDYWLASAPEKAADALAFWFLNSCERRKAHPPSQLRCLEVLLYLMWSTVVSESPAEERKTVWLPDFWESPPASWHANRLGKWALVAWALEQPLLAEPFQNLTPQADQLLVRLRRRLQHDAIQARIAYFETPAQNVLESSGRLHAVRGAS